MNIENKNFTGFLKLHTPPPHGSGGGEFVKSFEDREGNIKALGKNVKWEKGEVIYSLIIYIIRGDQDL